MAFVLLARFSVCRAEVYGFQGIGSFWSVVLARVYGLGFVGGFEV